MLPKQGILNLYKRFGETPIERLFRLKREDPSYADTVLSYVGRLDPMAEGVLLVVLGEENKNREKYLSFSKEYVAEILWGFETDSYDLLGMVTKEVFFEASKEFELKIETEVGKLIFEAEQAYPPYSSKTVEGKALWQWAREGKISEISIPTREINIESVFVISHNLIRGGVLKETIEAKIAKAKGNFRQKEILGRWQKALKGREEEVFLSATISFAVSSGTYIRGLAHTLGQRLGSGGMVLSLIRTRVGEYVLEEALP